MNDFFAILGGMGSIATENFIHGLNAHCGARKDQDYLRYVLYNNAAVPDRTDYILDKTAESPIPELRKSLQMLDGLQPQFIVMPCNTAHVFFDEVTEGIQTPVVHMLDAVMEEILSSGFRGATIGIAATQGTVAAGTYYGKLVDNGFQPYLPDEALQKKISSLIYDNVKCAQKIDMTGYHQMLDDFRQAGCDAVILGCTELSVFYAKDDQQAEDVFDSDYILMKKTIQLAKQNA